jgi:heat shock protein HslJ
VFEATLEDVSRADAPAEVIARDGGADRSGPPFAFTLAYDPAAIDPRNTYAVRARVTVDGRLAFTSDTAHPVITRGAPTEVQILMRQAERQAESQTERQAPATPRGLRGMVVYFADAARFTECLTGADHPVAAEGDRPALERAILAHRAGELTPILATIEGRIEPRPRMEGGGEEPTVVVDRLVAVWPGQSCAQAMGDASLTETYWRIHRLGELEPGVADGRREPHLILRSSQGGFAATVGCNQMAGGFELDGAGLRFGAVAATLMACPPPLDAAERALAETLEQTRTWRVNGHALELFDADGAPIALLEAVALP